MFDIFDKRNGKQGKYFALTKYLISKLRFHGSHWSVKYSQGTGLNSMIAYVALIAREVQQMHGQYAVSLNEIAIFVFGCLWFAQKMRFTCVGVAQENTWLTGKTLR